MTNKEAAEVLRYHVCRMSFFAGRGNAKSSIPTDIKLALIKAIRLLYETPDEEESNERL